MRCPCSSDLSLGHCCGAIISGKKPASTAEQLMRSRYTAFCMADIDYLIATMRNKATENFDPISTKKWAERVKWIDLKIIETRQGQTDDTIGWVEFKARYKESGKMHCIHELSEFHKIEGNWYYTSGQHLQ